MSTPLHPYLTLTFTCSSLEGHPCLVGQSQTAAEASGPETLEAMQSPGYVAQILEHTWVISIFSSRRLIWNIYKLKLKPRSLQL